MLLISCIWPPTRLCSLRPKLRVNSVSGPALFPGSSLLPGVNPVQACMVACTRKRLLPTVVYGSHNALDGLMRSDTPCTQQSGARGDWIEPRGGRLASSYLNQACYILVQGLLHTHYPGLWS